MPTIGPFLWFDYHAEEAAQHEVSSFPNSRIVRVTRFDDARPGHDEQVKVVEFELDGQPVMAIDGGPRPIPAAARTRTQAKERSET